MVGHHLGEIEQRHAIGASRVELLLAEPQPNAGRSASLQEANEFRQRPADPVDPVDQNAVDGAGSDRIEQCQFTGPPILAFSYCHRPVGENVGDRPSALGGNPLQFFNLLIG